MPCSHGRPCGRPCGPDCKARHGRPCGKRGLRGKNITGRVRGAAGLRILSIQKRASRDCQRHAVNAMLPTPCCQRHAANAMLPASTWLLRLAAAPLKALPARAWPKQKRKPASWRMRGLVEIRRRFSVCGFCLRPACTYCGTHKAHDPLRTNNPSPHQQMSLPQKCTVRVVAQQKTPPGQGFSSQEPASLPGGAKSHQAKLNKLT